VGGTSGGPAVGAETEGGRGEAVGQALSSALSSFNARTRASSSPLPELACSGEAGASWGDAGARSGKSGGWGEATGRIDVISTESRTGPWSSVGKLWAGAVGG